MDVVAEWTGRHACALQAALRLSQEEFAGQLGVARRTVASWHARPAMILRPDLQRALDTAHERAPVAARARFAHYLNPVPPQDAGQGRALTVAIAVVTKPGHVLLVCRRDAETSGLSWSFPAGVVKPGAAAELAAVRETLAETGIHCAVRAVLGERLHPVTGVHCEYYLCDFLAGDATNRDADEHVSVIWAPVASLTRFIPAEQLFPPILHALEEIPDARP
ncbi:NUDIX domain-containing protein [Streptosporangium sp. G11]|uniref:NUDIX hydrolase n=1 Tax=Streptosporangium sp. G11 TaxID=3436926 RepID=UPI003EB72C55